MFSPFPFVLLLTQPHRLGVSMICRCSVNPGLNSTDALSSLVATSNSNMVVHGIGEGFLIVVTHQVTFHMPKQPRICILLTLKMGMNLETLV